MLVRNKASGCDERGRKPPSDACYNDHHGYYTVMSDKTGNFGRKENPNDAIVAL